MPLAPPSSLPTTSFAPTPRLTGKRRAEEADCLERDAHDEKRPRVHIGASVLSTPGPTLSTPRVASHAAVQHDFSQAVLASDTAEVQRALLAGADVDAPLADGQPPALHYVAERPHLAKLLGTLMAARPNVQAAPGQVGPLFLAVSNGNYLGVRVLLEAGADPLHDHRGLTPWLLAAGLSETSAARLQLYRSFGPYVGAGAGQ